jgi:hypothetical protein
MIERGTLYRVLIIAAGVLIVFLSGKGTITLISNYYATRGMLSRYASAETDVSGRLAVENAEPVDLDKHSFEVLSKEATGTAVVIKKMDPSTGFDESGLEVRTKEILLEGGFKDIIRCLHAAEMQLKGIKITSVHFFTADEDRERKLFARVYLQSAARKNIEL